MEAGTHTELGGTAGAAPPRGALRAGERTISVWGCLLVATLLLVVVEGMAPPGRVQQLIATALAGTVLVLAVRVARLRKRWVRLLYGVGGVAILVSAGTAIAGDGTAAGYRVVNAVLVALAPPAIAIGLVRDLRASGQVKIESVSGVLSLYMLFGMFFAFLYGAMDRLGSGSFFAGGESATASRCLYFSFTTLTTVGYGDLTARTDAGHTFAILEALLGQIYLVTVVALIVSNLGRRR